MKKILFFFSLLAFFGLSVNAQNNWTSMANFGGTARFGAVGFSIGNKGYVGTGTNDNTTFYNDFWEYDPSTGSWTQKANFPGDGRQGAVGFSIGQKGYLGTGSSSNNVVYSDFWEYNPSTNTWVQKASFIGLARRNAVGFAIGSKGYIGTGANYINTPSYQDFFEYNPTTNTWTQKADFTGGIRASAVGFSICDKGYIGTGRYNSTNYNDFWEYNPSNNTWSQKTNFGGSIRYGSVGFSICTYGYIGLGRGSGNYSDFWEYNPNSDTWTQKTSFTLSARWRAVGFSVAGKGYVGTGDNGIVSPVNDFLYYTPSNSNVPSQPATITGTTTPCSGTINTYSVSTDPCATSYTWTLPSGWTGTSTTSSINATASTTSGNISVTANNDCGSSTPRTLSVTVKTVPAQPSAITGNANPCLGSQAYSVTNVSGVTYSWAVSGGGTITGSGNSISVNWTTDGTYTLTVTPSNSCGNGTPRTLSVTVITVPAQPTAITGSTNPCLGSQPYSVTNVSGVTYAWAVSGGGTITGSGNSVSVNWTTPGTYTVTVTPSNTCGNGTPRTLSVTVITTPSQPSVIAGNTTPCPVSENYSVTNISGVTYNWAVSGGGTIIGSGNTATANWTTAGSYTISVTPSNACGNGTPRTLIVNVNPNPSAPQITNNDDTTFCVGDSVILTSDVATTYLWNTSATTQSITATTQGNYTVTITDANGCSAVSQPMLITVNALPVANAGSDLTFCASDSAMLNATGGGTYSWSPATGLSCTTCQNPYASPVSTTTYTVVVTNTNGCTAMDSAIVTIATVLVANAGSDSAICPGESTTLNASGGTGYSWTPTTGLSNPNIANPVASPTTTTTYTVIVTSGTCSPSSDSVKVTVNPNPAPPTITVNPAGPNSVNLVASPSTGYYYQWYLNTTGTNHPITGATGNILFGADSLGYYSVEITDITTGCSAISSLIYYPAGIEEFNLSDYINVYPNPANDIITVESTLINKDAMISLYNIQGQLLILQPMLQAKINVDISAFSRGMYYLKVQTEKGIAVKKFIKE